MIKNFTRLAAALTLAAGLAATQTGFAAAPLTSLFPKAGLDLANLDTSCKACDDFYQFATGGWEKNNPIPAGYSAWGAFSVLAEDNRNVVHTVLEAAAKDTAAAPGSNEQKIGAFYRSCMDEAGIEAAGITPLKDELARIAAINNSGALLDEIGRLGYRGASVPFGFGASSDEKNSSQQIANIGFGGLGLPDRDFYFPKDDRAKAAIEAYRTYISTVLGLVGVDQAQTSAQADAVIALETTIATATPRRADLRSDPTLTYHPMSVAAFEKLTPDANWSGFFADYKAPAFDHLNVALPTYMTTVSAQLQATPLTTWKAYLTYHLIDEYAAALPKAFADASFAFHTTAFTGVKEQLPRWKRCTAATDRALGEALGAAYVEKVFPPAAKARALELVNNLQSALHDDIKTLTWMGDATKAKAEEKLALYTKKIGYPDHFRSYAKLDITDGPFVNNNINVRLFDADENIAHIGQQTDRARWGMSPPTVNAYYNPANNEIVFPAGILEPPFFSFQADDAVNYGAIGAVIGHEITHGFDTTGRQFDGHGNLTDWWTASDATNFKSRAQCIIDEFDAFQPAPGVNIQGKLVQGEAAADLGGITIAFKAFQHTPEYKAHKVVDGYTPEQRFFLAYAQVWAQNELEGAARQQALTNEHPDNKYRVIGTLSNMPEFRAAFHCVAGDKMVRAQSCQIW